MASPSDSILPGPSSGTIEEPMEGMMDSVLEGIDQEPRPERQRWENFDDIEVFTPGDREVDILSFLGLGGGRMKIASWYIQQKHLKPGEDIDNPRLLPFLRSLKSMVAYLDTIEITPRLHTTGGLRSLYQLVSDPAKNYPQFIVDRFERIYRRWEAVDFGATAKEEETESQDSRSSAQTTAPGSSSSTARPASRDNDVATARPPPKDHPIWGVEGIMHGLVRVTGAKVSYRLDPRYEQRPAAVFGHNNLTPGDWWPMQMVALFNGAHGSARGGISGRRNAGAFSIVVSKSYHGMDHDNGNTLFYSGSGSQENTDPNTPKPDTDATRALRYSMQQGTPVRVLRSENANSEWAPRKGIRYDGLYRIVREEMKTNNKNGKYRRFKLERLPGQKDLDQIRRESPSEEQLRLAERIKDGY